MIESTSVSKVLQGQDIASWDWTILNFKRGKQILQ